MSVEADCDFVRAYLDRFLKKEGRDASALEAVAVHVRSCAPCYDRMAAFFRTIEIPEATFLRETIDELCAAIYQLAVAVIRERKDPDVNTDNMVSVYTRGSAKEAAHDGRGMIDEAEEYVGDAAVGDVEFSSMRELIERAEMSREKKLDLAATLAEQILRFETRHVAVASNLLGVVRLWQSRRDEAEAAFLRTLAANAAGPDERVFKAFAHCNLAYLSQQKGDLPAAVLSARRSVALSEELGTDPRYGLFALLYFHVLEGAAAESRARETLERIVGLPEGGDWFSGALKFENNTEVAATLRASFVGRERPEFFAAIA